MYVKLITRHLNRVACRQETDTDINPSFTFADGPEPSELGPSPLTPANPLPTFTPPSFCLDSTHTLSPSGYDYINTSSSIYPFPHSVESDTFLFGGIIAHGPQSACFPSEVSTFGTSVTYSPGICPSVYVTATQSVVNHNTALTIATCCPQQLTLYVNGTDSVTTCDSNGISSDNVVVANQSTISNIIGRRQAYPIIVMYESTDADYLSRVLSTSSSSAQPGATSQTVASTASATAVTSSSTSTGNPLSTAAKAGIGVGAGIGGILLIILGILLWRRRAKKQITEHKKPEMIDKPESSGEGIHREMHGEAAVVEAGGGSRPGEVGDTSRAELESDWTGWEAPALLEVDLSRPRNDAPESEREQHHKNLLDPAKRDGKNVPFRERPLDSGFTQSQDPS